MGITSTKIVQDGHEFTIQTEADGKGGWRVEVVNASKSAFAFDPSFATEAEAIAHASDALHTSDISKWLG